MTLNEATTILSLIDVENISKLDDLPNDVGGLSAAELKATFDKSGVDLKGFLLDLITAIINAVDDAAKGITFQGVSGDSIQDNTISSEKLMSIPGAEAVTVDNIRNNAVSEAKLGVELAKKINDTVAGVATNGSRIALNTSNISALQTVVTALSTNKQNKHKTLQVLLGSGQSSWTVTANGVTASNTVITTADANSIDEAASKSIRCTKQATNQLTFTAKRSTSVNVTMNVLILD